MKLWEQKSKGRFSVWPLTVTPKCWSRFERERCAGCNWNLQRRGSHQFQQPELLGPAACCLRQGHCNWDRKCFGGGHCPWCWWWWQAAVSGTGSPQCPCVGFLGERNWGWLLQPSQEDTSIGLWRARGSVRRETVGNFDLWGTPLLPHDAERAVMGHWPLRLRYHL